MAGNLQKRDSKNVDFYKVFKGFRRNYRAFTKIQISVSWEQMPPTEFQWPHLRNTRLPTVFLRVPLRNPVAQTLTASHRHGICTERDRENVHFYKVFKGFRRNYRALMEMITPSLWGGLAETHVFPLFLEVPGGGPLASVQHMGLLVKGQEM